MFQTGMNKKTLENLTVPRSEGTFCVRLVSVPLLINFQTKTFLSFSWVETPVAEDDLTVIQTGNELPIYNLFRRYTSCVCVRTADDQLTCYLTTTTTTTTRGEAKKGSRQIYKIEKKNHFTTYPGVSI